MESLSDEWVEAVVRATDALPPVSTDLDHEVVVEVAVAGDETAGLGEVRYHLAVTPEGLRARPGRHPEPTVTLSQSRSTALALARGELSAKEAFMSGRLTIRGDVTELIEASEAFAAFEQVMVSLTAASDG